MKFNLPKALFFACIFVSVHSVFAQRDYRDNKDRDFNRENRRSGSTEQITNISDVSTSYTISQIGTNINVLSNIGFNAEISSLFPVGTSNDNGQKSIYIGLTSAFVFGSKDSGYGLYSISRGALDATLNYKIPTPNNDNLAIFIGAGGGYYYATLFQDKSSIYTSSASLSDSGFFFIAKSSVNYFLSPKVGIFGSVQRGIDGDFGFSAGLAFRKTK